MKKHKQAKNFIYKSYNFQPKNGKIIFKYEIEFKNEKNIEFIDEIILPKKKYAIKIDQKDKNLDTLLNSMHIILGISYYKLFIPPKVKLNKPITKKQADFFNTIYHKGLGEFCYKNKIDPKRIAKFSFEEQKDTCHPALDAGSRNLLKYWIPRQAPCLPCLPDRQAAGRRDDNKTHFTGSPFKMPQCNKIISPTLSKGIKNKILLGIAGGKDSIIAGELLKQQGENITGFIMDTHNNMQIPKKIAKIMGVKTFIIKHSLDKKIYNNDKSYKGHVPFSAMLAFIGTLTAYLYGYSYVAMANEYSANFGNIKYKGLEVNHQWSKTSEFEGMMQNYVHKYISQDITYFSALRPFYEIRVVEMFSKYKKYFKYFTSCNENFKLKKTLNDSLWCGKCPKCVFVFTLLSVFITKAELDSIFKKNLFEDKKLLPIFKDLLGLGKLKPFDCVGTFEEMRHAFLMASKKYKDTFIIKKLLKKVSVYNKKSSETEILKTQIAPHLPEQFKFFAVKNVLILGYGVEGKATEKYLKFKYKNKIKVVIADKKNDVNYLEKQQNFDLVIKTPGIPKKLAIRPYTTATNIFFSEIKKKDITTIGITGSKGKSTTASLIYSILKEAGKNVKLIGNIGEPMLKTITKKIKKNYIFVLELSSYQLDDIKFSPDIAVILNLFPDHMPYHGRINDYYLAKKNIINFQKKNKIFIYNSKNKLLKQWAKESKSTTISFNTLGVSLLKHTNLIGEHNKENIKAAITAVKSFNINDNIIKKAIKKFNSLPHRIEFIERFKDISFYNDSISTAPESAIAGIKALENIGTIILGGEDRGYNFKELEKIIKKYKIKNIVLFPDTGKRILKSKKGLNILETSSMEKAVKFAYANTPKNSICLLSPASPSHNLWENFKERGDEYVKWVKKYSNLE
ncbi:UDP-N-acetylmuramoyl-L-alanine--D-glutamate ligase [Patescibacteria group bacterium]